MSDARIDLSPDPVEVNETATVSVTFPGGNGWPVVVRIIDETTIPPTVIKERSFSNDPITMTFEASNVGPHDVEVLEGGDTTHQPFDVE